MLHRCVCRQRLLLWQGNNLLRPDLRRLRRLLRRWFHMLRGRLRRCVLSGRQHVLRRRAPAHNGLLPCWVDVLRVGGRRPVLPSWEDLRRVARMHLTRFLLAAFDVLRWGFFLFCIGLHSILFDFSLSPSSLIISSDGPPLGVGFGLCNSL